MKSKLATIAQGWRYHSPWAVMRGLALQTSCSNLSAEPAHFCRKPFTPCQQNSETREGVRPGATLAREFDRTRTPRRAGNRGQENVALFVILRAFGFEKIRLFCRTEESRCPSCMFSAQLLEACATTPVSVDEGCRWSGTARSVAVIERPQALRAQQDAAIAPSRRLPPKEWAWALRRRGEVAMSRRDIFRSETGSCYPDGGTTRRGILSNLGNKVWLLASGR